MLHTQREFVPGYALKDTIVYTIVQCLERVDYIVRGLVMNVDYIIYTYKHVDFRNSECRLLDHS